MIRLFHALPISLCIVGLCCVGLAGCNGGAGGNEGGVINVQPVPEEELPEASAGATCELIFECSCENPGHADEPTCVETESTELSEAQQAAQAAGLTYDAQCAGNLVAQAEAAGCAAVLPFDCTTTCASYHGAVTLGDVCTTPIAGQATWSDCAQGLLCLNGTCEDPCGDTGEFLGVGATCRDDQGEPLGSCDPTAGLFCDFETNACIALPAPGEPCYGGEVCGVGAVCDFASNPSVCIAAPGLGEVCNYSCDEGLYCDGVDGVDGTCVSLPGVGEPCSPQQTCSEGNYCAGSTCEVLPAWVCE